MKVKANNKLSVAIIGAGISGVACALKLQSLGFEVQAYKKCRGASGRLESMIEYHYSSVDGLDFCGDWLHGDRVEGAWLSSIKLANKISGECALPHA